MSDLPTAEALARLVSRVTETMFGLSFSLAPDESGEGGESGGGWPHSWRTAVLPIAGARPLTVAIASDPASGRALGGAMFACAPDHVDPLMIDDSLTELVNIIAGQVKSSLGIDQALGLPKLITQDAHRAHAASHDWRGATLRQGATQLKVWVAVTDKIL